MPMFDVSEIVPLIEYVGSALAMAAPNDTPSTTNVAAAIKEKTVRSATEFVFRDNAKPFVLAPKWGVLALLGESVTPH